MGGKRKDYDAQFAMIETNFILDDARLDDLTGSQKWLYITLWVWAVQQRKDTICSPSMTKTLARQSREDYRSIAPALAKLLQRCLIEMPDENTIIVCGVKDKHPNLSWKDSGISDHMPQPIRNKNKERRIKNKEIDKESNPEPSESFLKAVNNSSGALVPLTKLKVTPEYFDQLKKEFPLIPVEHEMTKAELWLQDNPKRSYKRHHSFMRNWIEKAEERRKEKLGNEPQQKLSWAERQERNANG